MAAKTTPHEPLAPEPVRRRTAHVLAAVVAGQGVVAFGAVGWRLSSGGAMTEPVLMALVLGGVVSLVAAGMEWTRMRLGEAMSLAAAVAGFCLVIFSVLAGLWQVVPFQGILVIGIFLALVERYSVRDEERHAPKHV